MSKFDIEFGNLPFERAILMSPDDPFYPEHQDTLLAPNPKKYSMECTWNEEFHHHYFRALIIWFLLGTGVFIFSSSTNLRIIDEQVQKGSKITFLWLIMISIILAILAAHMTFRPYLIDHRNGSSVVLSAVIIYIII